MQNRIVAHRLHFGFGSSEKICLSAHGSWLGVNGENVNDFSSEYIFSLVLDERAKERERDILYIFYAESITPSTHECLLSITHLIPVPNYVQNANE